MQSHSISAQPEIRPTPLLGRLARRLLYPDLVGLPRLDIWVPRASITAVRAYPNAEFPEHHPQVLVERGGLHHHFIECDSPGEARRLAARIEAARK